MAVMLVLVLLGQLSVHVLGQSLPAELGTTLLSLVAEERNLRAQLEAEADLLERELDKLTTLRQNATCGCPSLSSSPVAFTATLGHNIATLGKQQAIIYEEVTLNLGDAYDVRHGIFTAPFAGLYEFTAVVLNRGGVSTGLSLVLNGEAVTKVQSGDSSYYTMGTNAVALKLVAGDEVWVRHTDQSDSNSIQGESTSSFTGYLIDV
ncbi:complement C1q-like protein 4 [Mya arenaria]|uniref:complement C1q-like protein 4 n=1 Tax=Mya arenaria TaxID=6604 RepID=UPI0022E06A0C|nr:complement C1q-like protein 4 [Mya arenaria]